MNRSLQDKTANVGGQDRGDTDPRNDVEPLTVTIEPFSEESKSYKAKHYRLDRCRYWLEKRAFRATHRSLAVLALYTGLTLLLAVTSIIGTCYTKKSLDLTRDGVIGTQAAVVVFNTNSPATEPNPIRLPSFNVNVGLKNDGRVIANKVEIRFTVQVEEIATGNRVGKRWECGKVIGEMPVPTNSHPADYVQCYVEGIRPEDFQNIVGRKSTIAVEGAYTYGDGFGDYKSQPFCFKYAHPVTTKKYGTEALGLMGCDDFPRWFAIESAHLSEDRP